MADCQGNRRLCPIARLVLMHSHSPTRGPQSLRAFTFQRLSLDSRKPQGFCCVTQEARQQSMADYGAELQAQIAEKEKQKRLKRQDSLRESQQLLAQRMTVPSGLVCPTQQAQLPLLSTQ